MMMLPRFVIIYCKVMGNCKVLMNYIHVKTYWKIIGNCNFNYDDETVVKT